MRIVFKIIRRIVHDILMVISPPFLKRKLMSCKEISEILAKETELSGSKKLMFKMHLLICQCCTNYASELSLISESAKKIKAPNLNNEQLQQIQKSKQELIDRFKP